MPFTSTPLYSTMEKVQPKVTPISRQIVESESVRIINKNVGL